MLKVTLIFLAAYQIKDWGKENSFHYSKFKVKVISIKKYLYYLLLVQTGALNLTRHANKRSKAAEVEVEYTVVIVSDSDRIRKQTNRILIYSGDRFNRTISANDEAMERLSFDLNEMEDTIPELNNQVFI